MATPSLQPTPPAPSSSASVFDALKIDRSKKEFRIWRFSKDESSEDHLHLHMEVFPMDSCPKYIALSYVWGTYENTKPVVIDNSGTLNVTENLWDFLLVLYTAETDRKTNAWYWADQISIDQQIISERGHQVGLMGDIFSKARIVFAYLGPEPHESITDIQVFKELAPAYSGSRPYLFKEIQHESLTLEEQRYWLMTFYLFTRGYWSRLWIVQELRLASHFLFWCGRFVLDGVALDAMLGPLKNMESPLLSTIEGSTIEATTSRHREDLLESLYAFYDELQWNFIRRLLSKRRLDDSAEAWFNILIEHGMHKCTDDRDKIFGLQAILKPEVRIRIDYSKTFGQLLREIIERLLIEKLVALRWESWRGSSWGWLTVALEDNIKSMARACQKKQTLDLNPLRPSLKDSLKDWGKLPNDIDKSWTDLVEIFSSTFSRHGFVMTGDFLYHPEDAIPFSQFEVPQSEYSKNSTLSNNE